MAQLFPGIILTMFCACVTKFSDDSSSMVPIWVSLVIGALIIRLLYKWATGPSLPRGPRGLPFVGNVFQIDPTGLHKTLAKWGETYGGVFTINVLGQDIVVLRSFEALYEGLVLKENDLSGRPFCYRAREVKSQLLTQYAYEVHI